eukprot:COSAG02_NODE_31972_length_524_cov_0.955294_1_plen_97_part_10
MIEESNRGHFRRIPDEFLLLYNLEDNSCQSLTMGRVKLRFFNLSNLRKRVPSMFFQVFEQPYSREQLIAILGMAEGRIAPWLSTQHTTASVASILQA